MYDYWNGMGWEKVSAEWLNGVNLNGLKEVYADAGRHIRCVYQNGEEVYYENHWGTWGFPCVVR